MSDAPEKQFLLEFGIGKKRACALMCRVTQIIAKNLKISDEPGSDVLQCVLDKGACVRDIVQYIECKGLSTIDAQWMFFAFGASIGNDDRLCEIARAEYTARQLFETLKTETAQEE